MKTGDIQFEVIVGTYEEFVLGYQFLVHQDGNKRELVQTFATHSHRASVRSVACGGKLVVTGGADENINIYNMLTRQECGMLMEHNGTITSLSFTPDCSHLISTSEDGTIKVFRQGSWQLEKVWHNAHKGTAVTCLSVHPSGKMALSVGKDHTLRTWNLVKGRPAYTTNLFSRCRQLEVVVWSPGGQLFAIPMDCQLEISSAERAGVLHTLKLPSKVTACAFVSDGVVCVGEASGAISGHCTETAKQLWSVSGDQRIRGLAYFQRYLVTATSSGSVRVYSVDDDSSQPQQVACADTGCRITCLTLYDHKSETRMKKKPSDDISTKFKEKKRTKIDQDETEANTQVKLTLCHKTGLVEVDDAVSVKTEKETMAELKSQGKLFKKQKYLNSSSSFTEVDNANTKVNLKKKISEFHEKEKKSTKKQKLSHENTKLGGVICSPQAQKWVVEDTTR